MNCFYAFLNQCVDSMFKFVTIPSIQTTISTKEDDVSDALHTNAV